MANARQHLLALILIGAAGCGGTAIPRSDSGCAPGACGADADLASADAAVLPAPDAAPDRGADLAPDLAADLAPDLGVDASAGDASSAVDAGDAPPSEGGAADVPPAGNPALVLTPQRHDFSATQISAISDAFIFTVTNLGTGAAAGLTVEVGGTDFVAPPATDKCAAIALAPGASCTVEVLFQPRSRGPKSGSLVARSGTQTLIAALAGLGQSPPHLLIQPTSASVSGIAGTASAPVHIIVVNSGDVATGLLTLALAGVNLQDFSISSNGCVTPLSPLSTCSFDVVLNAATPGMKSATATVTSVPGGMASMSLNGVVLSPSALAITPDPLDFGSVNANAMSTPRMLEVKNTGGSASSALSVSLASNEFAISANTCGGSVLPAGGTCSISLVFKPTTPGPKSGLIVVGGVAQQVSGNLTGFGL